MRHMRSRRILAMLLALSMIFGLLTTTAFAGEVDQNTSNVGESAANGTSEGGSGEGQSSGASEDESSKVTNKEDVPTEEETIPEEKKTTSSEEVDTQEGEGENPTEETNNVASIGEQGYESLDAAIQAAQDNDTIVVSAGEYTLNGSLTYTNKAFMIKAADGETVSFDMSAAVALHGAKITFEGVTFNYKTNGNYIGLQHADTLVYNNCVINGMVFLYATNETFNNCTFNQTSADAYNVWTYGAKNVAFNSCTFNCVGKSVLVYNEGANAKTDLNVNDTTFNASAPVEGKAAIEIDTSLMTEGATITVDANTTADGFATGSNSGSTLWNDKKQTADTNKNTTVTVANEAVFVPKSTGVATVDGVSYDTLDAAFAALNSTNHTLTLLDESKWDVNTPVYWKAGNGEYAAAASLVEALTAAYKANAGDITIICRPGADVGEMTHGHVADNLTIYGNDAYISGGECELEVDTFKFDRNTGKQATDGVTLDKDITITAYELDNLGVWGQRNTGYTVNVNLTDCDTVQGITVQRVYISGTTGMNNITLTGCDFGTTATSVYSNADGDINITNCSFTGAQVPVNFNHKTDGEQTLRVSNCEFNACGDAGEWKQFAAPVRFVNSGSGSQTASVNACTFADTVGPNGDILIGDGRPGQKSNDVNLTVTDTEANIQAQKPGYYNGNETDTSKLGTVTSPASGTLTTSVKTLISGGETSDAIVDEKTLRKALYEAPADGTQTIIKLENDITLDMLYAAENFDEEKLDDNAAGDTFNRYKLGVHPTEDDPDHWNPLVTNQSQEARLLYGAYYHMSATDERIARLVVKAGQDIVLDLNGHTIQKNPRATHGDWSNTCTDILANYGTLTITDTSTGTKGTIKGNGYISCDGAVLHNYADATMNVGAINVDGNAKGMSKGTGQYVVVNEGGTLSIDGANIFDTATSASLLVNTTGTMSVKNATLSHPATKTFNVKGGTVEINEGVEIASDTYAIFVKGGTVKLNADVSIQASTAGAAAGTLAIEGETATVEKAESVEMEAPAGYKWENNVLVKAPEAKKVAKVGDTEYATLEAAVAAVTDTNNTITLLTDVIQNTQLALNRSLTLNLDGHTIKNENDIWGEKTYCLLRVEDNAVVTITGNGTVAAKKDDCYAISITSGSLTIENGTFIGNISAVQVETGSLTIKDGTFKQIQESKYGNTYVINCIDGEFASGAATVAIYGGTFVGFDPNVSPEKKDENGNVPSFAAPGVGIEKNTDGTFTAKAGMVAQILDASGNSVKAYKTLAEAFTEASEGQTVRLLANATEDVTIDKNITLDLGGKMLTNTGAGKATITIANGATATVKNGSVVGGTSYYNIQNNGTATFEGLTTTAGNTGSSMIDNVGTLTITSGEYTGGLDTIKNEPNAKLTVDGGTFTLTKGTSDGFTGVIFNYGELTINDGTFIQNDKSAPYGQAQVIHTDKSGSNAPSTVIKGGTFKNLCTRSTAWTVRATNAAAGATKVSGGTFNKSISEDYCADGFIPTKNADGTYGVKKGKYVATVDDTGYETLAAAVKTKINGKTVMLLDDVTENIEITKAKNFTLDLNGHTINGGTVKDKATITNYGTVTIIDSSAAKTGTIKRDDNGTVGETSYYVIRNIGTMTIEQANVTNNSGYKKTNPSGSMVGSSLICNGDDDLGGTLNISGGKFEQKNFIAIKNGALGKLNVTGGTISSDHSAIQNWFEATITGGEINGQLWTDAYIVNESVGHTTIGGSAKYTGEIVMDIYGSVKPELEISGGTLDVTNWRITTAASKAGAKPAVSGGKFTSAVPENYCADGYVPTKNEDGTYGVKVDDSVAEVGGVKYLSLQAAINAAKSGATVKLLKDTKENVTISKKLTLDLNGKTLNGGQVKGTPALKVDNASVTIQDSSAAQTGTIMREDTAENSGKTSHYVIDVQGKYGFLKIEGGNIKNNSGVVGASGKGASLIRLGNDSVSAWPTLTIKGGTFTQNNFIAIKVDRGTLHLLGGEINSANSYAIENWNNAYIKGGTVNGTVSSWVYSTGVAFSKLEISGGTVNGNVASVNYDSAADKQARIYITGGEVTGTLGTYTYSNGLVPTTETAMATVEVTGGTFDKDPTTYVVEGSTVNKNSEGKFGVEKAYLCKIGEKQYYTMSEAFHAVQAGETITMLRDYTTNSVQNSGDDSFTIDLNGFTWTYTGTDTDCAAFEINYPEVSLTVKNGKVISGSMLGLVPTAKGGLSGTIYYSNSSLVFENVVATANGHSGIETNGGNENVTVTLKDSTLNVPNGFGIYFPSSGKLTIDNSKITAKTLGVQVCSGSLDISGAETKIEVTGNPVPKTENDGAIQDGAAISIVNRTGYKGLDKITVTEGIFTAKSGNAAVKAYNWENKTASDFTASDKVAISGGSYSTVVPADLCAEGFVPVTTANDAGLFEVKAVEGDAELLDADGKRVKYGYANQLATDTDAQGKTIKLFKDTTNGGFMLPAGVTLDLNGKTMTSSFMFATGDVIDSADGTGKLVVGQKNVLFQKHEMYLPLYDGTGYRFFQYQIVTGKLTKESPTSVKARLQLKFTNANAYTLLINDSTGAHGMALNLIISWNAIRTQDQNWRIGMPNTVLSSTLNAMRNAGVDPSERFFTLTINGVNVLGSGETLYAKAGLTNRAWPGTSEAAYGSEVSIAID